MPHIKFNKRPTPSDTTLRTPNTVEPEQALKNPFTVEPEQTLRTP